MNSENEQNKIVVVVRKDLKLPIGKWIAQVVHGILLRPPQKGFHLQYKRDLLQPICVVCYVKQESDFNKLEKKCQNNNIIYSFQVDAGHNFVSKGTKTCMIIGPDETDKINKVTKRLQLLK